MSDLAIVTPGTDLVPDGWADSTVVPWLAEQFDESALKQASAQLAGLETAYRTLDVDTLELVKARRFLEPPLSEGQKILLSRLARLPRVTVLLVKGTPSDLRISMAHADGTGSLLRTGDFDDYQDEILSWYSHRQLGSVS